MDLLVDHFIESRGLEHFANEIIADDLAHVRGIESRHWDRRAEGRRFAFKPFVAGDTIDCRRRSSEEGGPSGDRARRQNAPSPGRGVSVFEESLTSFIAEQPGKIGRVAGTNRLHQLIGCRAVEGENNQARSRCRRWSGVEFFFAAGPERIPDERA